MRENDLANLIYENIKLLNQLDKSIEINFINYSNNVYLNCDNEQISRVFKSNKKFNESIQQKVKKTVISGKNHY